MSTTTLLAQRRLRSQHLARPTFTNPADVVAWLGAVQAQDYQGAKWAVGMRTAGATDATIEDAFARGDILRTHVLRPTWHFVTPADIRWMLALTAPRVNRACSYQYRRLELNDTVFRRSNAALARALRGGHHRTRAELAAVLERAGIPAKGQRLACLVMRAEQDAVVCSGGRRRAQLTYALLDERAPQARTLARDEALAELAARYFTSHGPATVRDYAWWSGLTAKDARIGVDMIRPQLARQIVGETTYWFVPSASRAGAGRAAYLLPNYDEFFVAYRARDAELTHQMVVDGRSVGPWGRTITARRLLVEARPVKRLGKDTTRRLAAASERYGRFLALPVRFKLV